MQTNSLIYTGRTHNSPRASEVDKQAFGNPKQYEFLEKHFQQLDTEIEHLKQDLPAHNAKLETWITGTVRSQQCGRVKTVSWPRRCPLNNVDYYNYYYMFRDKDC